MFIHKIKLHFLLSSCYFVEVTYLLLQNAGEKYHLCFHYDPTYSLSQIKLRYLGTFLLIIGSLLTKNALIRKPGTLLEFMLKLAF